MPAKHVLKSKTIWSIITTFALATVAHFGVPVPGVEPAAVQTVATIGTIISSVVGLISTITRSTTLTFGGRKDPEA